MLDAVWMKIRETRRIKRGLKTIDLIIDDAAGDNNRGHSWRRF